jgi:hypothetical protein
MTLSMFVKGKVDIRHVQIWLWICLLNEKLNLDTSKSNFKLDMIIYDFDYVCQKKSWL